MCMFKNTTVGMLIAFSATNAHVSVSTPYTIHKTMATRSKKNVTGLKSSVFFALVRFHGLWAQTKTRAGACHVTYDCCIHLLIGIAISQKA